MALRRIALTAAVVAATPTVAHAEPVFTDTSIVFEFRLPDGKGGYELVGAGLEGRPYEHFFNQTRCLCGQQQRDSPTEEGARVTVFGAYLSFAPQPTSTEDVDVQIWTGTGCDDDLETQRNCGPAPIAITTDDDILNGTIVELNVAELLDPEDTGSCPTSSVTPAVFALTDPDGDNVFDDKFSASVNVVDPQPPPLPASFTLAAGGEGAVSLSWETPSGNDDDIYYWQVLCARASDGMPAPDAQVIDALYETTQEICALPSTHTVATLPVDSGSVEVPAGGFALPAGLQNLDAAYLCGQTVGTDTTIRIDGLDNDEDYYVVLVSVDEAGNFAAGTLEGVLSPQPATDFWEDLNEDDDNLDGGFCLIAETYGDGGGPGGALTSMLRDFRDDTLAGSGLGRWLTARYYEHLAPLGELARSSPIARIALAVVLLPVVAVALLWHALTLPGLLALLVGAALLRRRIKQPRRRGGGLRPALAAAAAMLALGATAAPASAQSFAPYWEDETPLDDEGPSQVKWHAAFKLGPYVPGIDQQLGHAEGEGPYAEMFGTELKLLPVLEVDRFLLWPRGQLGVGGSIGFFSQSANAFQALDPTPGDGVRDRSPGDKTRFRMLPLAIHAIYRLTMLDDDYGIPVVPYLRAGLAYYVWWITAPDGDVARVCAADGSVDDGMCSLDKARGGSLGVQGSLGLAIRAERIDRGAALSMRDSGLYHVGFFAEYQLAKVDDFGSDSKLSVGDSTWYAGIDFEF